jgi:hypothetical protein
VPFSNGKAEPATSSAPPKAMAPPCIEPACAGLRSMKPLKPQATNMRPIATRMATNTRRPIASLAVHAVWSARAARRVIACPAERDPTALIALQAATCCPLRSRRLAPAPRRAARR